MARNLVLLVGALLNIVTSHKNTNQLPTRNTIVHLFEWKWNDIADECENFLGPKGYAGVQVSPANENVVIPQNPRPWWERYQPVSYELITRSGNEEEFAKMVTRCNKAGVRIYVDVIINHMAAFNPSVGVGSSTGNPSTLMYPGVPYGPLDFNQPQCSIDDYQDAKNIRNCNLVGLPDLNQTSEYVRGKIVNYFNHLIDLGVAGFRVDAAKHMWPNDLEVIYDRMKNLNTSHGFSENSRPYIYQEVIDPGTEAVSRDEYVELGAVSEFRFGELLGEYFRGQKKLADLQNWGPKIGLLADEDGIIFIDNHDNQRGHGNGRQSILTFKTPKNYKMAIAFMLAHPYGNSTRIISSYNFNNTDHGPPEDFKHNILSPIINKDGECDERWVCEHRWRQIYNMVAFRQQTKDTEISEWWDNGKNKIAFCRGDQGFIAFTLDGDLKQKFNTCLPAGKYCDVASGLKEDGKCSGKTVNVDQNHTAYVEILSTNDDGFLAIHQGSKL